MATEEPRPEPFAGRSDENAIPARRIVVGYVRSPEGEAALNRAIAIARRDGDHITVIYAAAQSEASTEIDYYDQELTAIERILENEAIAHDVRVATGGSSGAAAILKAINDTDADLAIIGVRNRSRVGKALLGSDAQTIILQAPCPVLAVRAPQK